MRCGWRLAAVEAQRSKCILTAEGYGAAARGAGSDMDRNAFRKDFLLTYQMERQVINGGEK